MPPNNHLQWVEITDFAPGVFTVSDWLIPPNGSQIMEDCYPQVGGGLRAFVKPSAVITTGIDSVADETVIGCFIHYPANRHGVGNRADHFVATVNTSTKVTRLYRYDLSDAATQWVKYKQFAAAAGTPQPVQFAKFSDTTYGDFILAGFYSVSADDGLWALSWSDTGPVQTPVKINNPAGGGRRFGPTLAVQDDRIIVVEWPNILWYSNSLSVGFNAANYLELAGSSSGNSVTTIVPFAPSDLFVGLSAQPWRLVQGDITDPIVRSMSSARTPGGVQTAAFTQGGLMFIGHKVGAFLTSTGETFQDLSAQIAPSTWDQFQNSDVGTGDIGYDGNLAFCPRGYVYDFRTNSWFTTSYLSRSGHLGQHFASFAPQKRVLASATGSGVELWNYDVSEADADRCPSYTWKSAPLRAQDGRQMEIREVQVYARGYNAGSTLTVTVGTKTKTLPVGAAKQMVSFLMVQRAEVLDVQVVSASNDPDVEAPSIEAVRIGAGHGHLSH